MSLREILNLSCSFLTEVALRLDLCGFDESPLTFTDLNLSNLCTKYRGRGIATQMMTALLEEGRKQGIEEFTLEVRVSNAAAIKVYEKMGFVSEGIRPRFYEQPVEDAMIMWKR